MKKRITAIFLIGLLVLTTAGCKAQDADGIGVLEQSGVSGNVQDNGGEMNQPSDAPSSNEDAQNDINGTTNGSGENSPTNNGGTSNPSAQNPAGTNQQGNGGNHNQSSGGNSASKPEGNSGSPIGQSGLKETFAAGKPITVAAGETIWYGPASTAQQNQLTFTDSNGNAVGVGLGGVQKIDTFGNGYVLYSYQAAAAGTVSIQVADLYKDLFLATKEPMDMNAFYQYWDNQKGRNLYDAGLDKSSKWIDTAGKAQKSDLGGSTHAIPVRAGETLTFGPVKAGATVLAYGYDAQMKPIQMINGYGLKEAFTFPQGMRTFTYTVSEGIAYVRFNVGAEESESFAIMKNNEFDQKAYQRLTGANPNQVEDPLYKKNCLFVGDSICSAGHDTADVDGLRGWARRVKELSGAYCINEGVSGAALSDCRLGRGTEYHIIHKQISKHSGTDFDYVLIHGGTNDAWDKVPIGKVTKEYDPVFFDLTTYAGGLEYAIYTAIIEYGDTAAFGYLMNFQMPRNVAGVVATQLGDYFEVGKQICEKWNISYFDMFNHPEINRLMDPMSDVHLPDGTHPDESGYDILGPYITEYMRSMTPVTQKILDELASI